MPSLLSASISASLKWFIITKLLIKLIIIIIDCIEWDTIKEPLENEIT